MKLRKLAAVFMTAVMAVTTLAACGNDEEEVNEKTGSFKSSIEEGLKIENCSYEGKISISVKGEDLSSEIDESLKEILGMKDDSMNMALTMKGKTDKDNGNAEAVIGVALNDNAIKADLLELMMVDGTSYIGVETLTTGIADIVKKVTGQDISSNIKETLPNGAYLKVTKEMLQDILEAAQFTASGMASGLLEQGTAAADEEKVSDLMEYFADIIDKGIKKGAKDAYSNDGDVYKLTINKSNINGIVEGLADVIASKSDEISKKLSDIMGTEIVDADTLKSSAEMLKAYDVAALMGDVDFEMAVTTQYKDDVWNLGFSFNIKEGSNEVEVGLDYKAEKDDDLEIKAPTDLISDEDTETIMNLITSGMGAIEDGGLGDLDDMDDTEDADDVDDEDNNYTYGSIKEFAESEEFQTQLKTLVDSIAESGMKLEVNGEGNKLIYSYTYTDIVVDDTTKATMADVLEEGLESQASQFTSLAASLDEEINVEDPIVKIEYLDSEGTVIYEKEFTEE